LNFLAIEFQGTNDVSVSVNGSLLATLNFAKTTPINNGFGPFNNTWESFNYTFQATSLSTTLTFHYNNQLVAVPEVPNGFQYDLFYGSGGIDAISVTVAPEPSTVVLLGAGLFGWLIRRRRSSRT
jgi:hypothetical protein